MKFFCLSGAGRLCRESVLDLAQCAPATPDVGIALASISDEKLALRLPMDTKTYELEDGRAVYRTDETGRHRLGRFDIREPVLRLDLPPRGICIIEFCAKKQP